MIKRIRTLAVTFDTRLNPWELPRFRGAMATKVGFEHEWFHNHNNETGGLHHRYPLIQYKVQPHDGGFRPMLLCIEEGIEEAHHFFSKPDWDLEMRRGSGGETAYQSLPMRIAQLNVQQYTLGCWEEPFLYRIHNWQALNTDHYLAFRKLEGLAERYAYLEQIAANHILSFARGVNWTIPQHFDVKITKILSEKYVKYKGVHVLTFSLEFKTALSLPEWISLGKGGSVGYGVLRRQRRENKYGN
ncbi:MAG: CRISPR-associated endonuclease Cas6 [Saprospiraceae bacterium]